MIKQKTLAFWIGLIAPLLAIVTLVYGMMTKGFIGQVFENALAIALYACIGLSIIEMVTDLHAFPVLTTMAYGAALGLAIYYGAPTLSDYFNNVSFMGGDLVPVVTYIVLTGSALLIRWVIAFLPMNQKEKAAVR